MTHPERHSVGERGREQHAEEPPALGIEAQLWREISQHLELEESLRRVAPLLCAALPIDAVLIRRIERDPLRLTTVAVASCDSDQPLELRTSRSECDREDASAIERWLQSGRAELCSSASPTTLGRVLLPADLRGSVIAGVLRVQAKPVAVLLLFARGPHALERGHIALAQRVIEPLAVAYENDHRLHELARMREALEADRQALLSRLDRQDISDTVVGATAGLHSVMERVDQVARTDAPVLILGETGSGKEVIARAIHARSRRASGPVVRINCGAIPPELIDSELFGHERGSFTGAVGTRKGWFERADGGTLFLDEIGELPLAAQVRLLRVLQDGSLERVGGTVAITVDVRIVCATHRNLEVMVAEGRFREDLWYRISVFPIRLPPLRERAQDIPALAAHFARRAGQRLGGASLVPTERDIALLSSYAWPGNVRELAAVIERAAILGDGKRLEVGSALGTSDASSRKLQSAPPPAPSTSTPAGPPPQLESPNKPPIESLDRAMAAHIERALNATHGRIEGPFGAAKLLGINPHTLRARMRKLGIDWARYRGTDSDRDPDPDPDPDLA
jgi:transcriptional regulator with GAF, ATPase, and Fis domain